MDINLGPLSTYSQSWAKKSQQTDSSVSGQDPRNGQQSAGDGKPNNVSEKTQTEKPAEANESKAVFAVDENKNVVIRILDSGGKVVKQIPAEDYVKMAQQLEQSAKSLFHKET
ncbi:flagellar protein FlaG [Candidatus Magnetomonas plexicatena]|uniref:flagellar protein FlaG n=1 Tax=Candidatus Magnetomonas plexicatena TaxID=2552947 RepID=UPI001104591C|nr:flagellar protein FlaG [Nitrospirales bacterium LBB_01]